MNLFVTGIGTNVGKTIVSAILAEALQADYWKPIQSGVSEGKDAHVIKSLITNTKTVIYPESYLLDAPLSPHYAAKLEGITIELKHIHKPVTTNHLIIEGAGGLLVPINENQYVIDIARKVDGEMVLVISNYLGCINHTLLSLDYLMRNNYKVNALVFNGSFEDEIKEAIVNYAPNIKVIDIPTMRSISKSAILEIASSISW